MAEGDSLRALHVGIARQKRGGVLARAPAQDHARLVDSDHDGAGRRKREELHVRGHLVVAAARRMQAAARVADKFDKPVLDVHVDVFEGGIHLALAAFELARHLLQAGDDFLGIIGSDKPHLGQHAGMGLAAAHVVAQEATVEIHAGIQGRRRFVHGLLKTRTTAAGFGGRLLVVLFAHHPPHYQGPSLTAPGRHAIVMGRPGAPSACGAASLAAKHRGRIWEPFQGSHYNKVDHENPGYQSFQRRRRRPGGRR